MSLTFKEFRDKNDKRNEQFYHEGNWEIERWTNAIAGEAGEACNLSKKLGRLDEMYGLQKFTPEEREKKRKQWTRELERELGDVVIYCNLLASELGCHLEDLVKEKFNEKSKEINGCDIYL